MAVSLLCVIAPTALARDLGPLVKKQKLTLINITSASGGDTGGAEAINDDGLIVGYANSSFGSNSYNAFAYDLTLGFRFLPSLPGGRNTSAVSINKQGQSVGGTEVNHEARALLWEKSGELVELHPGAEWTSSGAFSINDNGEVLGYARTPPLEVQFIWSAESGYSYFTNLGLAGLNKHGNVIGIDETGWFYAESLDQAPLYVTLPENYGVFRFLTDNRLIVGLYQNDAGYQQAFRYRPNGKIVPLENLPGTPGSFPLSANDRNQIVGMPDATVGAALWEGNKVYNLNDLIKPGSDWRILTRASGINNRGWIVGGGNTTNTSAGYLLRPKVDD